MVSVPPPSFVWGRLLNFQLSSTNLNNLECNQTSNRTPSCVPVRSGRTTARRIPQKSSGLEVPWGVKLANTKPHTYQRCHQSRLLSHFRGTGTTRSCTVHSLIPIIILSINIPPGLQPFRLYAQFINECNSVMGNILLSPPSSSSSL